ncbi:MAG: hypothetical protein ACI4VJ_01815 [Methanosphaera sp.]
MKNGIVTYTINADLYLRNAKNITATYSGSTNYVSSRSKIAIASIVKRNSTLTVKTVNSTKQNTKISFIATVKDTTINGTNKTVIDNGYMIFKINGITIKDTNGNPIKVAVHNGVAVYNYTVPRGTSSVNDKNILRNYTVTAVYCNYNYNNNSIINYTKFTVEKSKINITFNEVTLNSKQHKLSIKANIKDLNDKLNVQGVNKICIKINGKTLKDSKNRTIYFTVTNGVINLSNITVPNTKIKSVMIVTGDRQAYTSARNQTTRITIK